MEQNQIYDIIALISSLPIALFEVDTNLHDPIYTQVKFQNGKKAIKTDGSELIYWHVFIWYTSTAL